MEDRLHLFSELGQDEHSSSTTGFLPSQKIKELIREGHITAEVPITEEQIQPASLDLRLGSVAFRVQASFLPGQMSVVNKKMQDLMIAEIDLTRPTVFEKGCVYIVPLIERLALPDASKRPGQGVRPYVVCTASPKSTTGRLDIFTRLITDYSTGFDHVPSRYKGNLYIEIVPRAFSIIVHAGISLNQLRFARGNLRPSDSRLNKLNKKEPLVYRDEDTPGRPHIDKGLRISINLMGEDHVGIIGYRAKKNTPVIDLQRTNYYEPDDFWDIYSHMKTKRIILNPGDFYILGSKERIRVPPDYAAEMIAFDPSLGEFRSHYAGFFDPGFGYGRNDIKGTQAVLEVRAHEVPFLIEHGQVVGRLIYTHLLEKSDKVYGPSIGSSYQMQGLSLSKQFKKV